MSTRIRRFPYILFVLAAVALFVLPAGADMVSLIADRDNVFTDFNNTRSNGRGIYACVGVTGQGAVTRAVYHFDLSSIPPGSLVSDVQFDLWIDANSGGVIGDMDLHLLLQDWGEGNSDAPTGECQGANSLVNDANWIHRIYNGAGGGSTWNTPGGTFAAQPSATTLVSNLNAQYTWSSPQLIADVQSWVDNSGSNNFGWLLKDPIEDGFGNALRFRSRHNPSTTQRPRLRVTFDPPGSVGACCSLGPSCSDGSISDCITAGGVFQGNGTTCAGTTCVDPTGACCASDGTCTVDTELLCQAGGGVYQGDGESCAVADCPIELPPFVDALPIPAVAQPDVGVPGGTATYTISMREAQHQMHRDLPPTTIWGYSDGPTGATFPGPTLEGGVDQPMTIHFANDLRDTSAPGDPKPLRTNHYLPVAGTSPPPACHIHGAEDKAKAVVHLHGGHVPAAVDGYPEDNYDPGQIRTFVYPNNQEPGTLWYHDHALGITRLNVYMGLAGFYLIRDAFEASLNLPSGAYEVPLAITDRSFNPDGTLDYPADIQEVFFGDFILVNGKVWPFHDVDQGKYRFRILNASGSRTYTLTLDRLDLPGTANMDFVWIGTDGGLRETPLTVNEITLSPAERADVIVDFQGVPAGTEIVLTNSAPAPFPGVPGFGVIPDVMKFIVTNDIGDTTAIPATLRPVEQLQESDSIRTRDFTLDKFSDACGGIWKINDLEWDDIVEYPQLGTTEIWQFINPSPVTHPMHMHLVFFQVLDRVPIGGGPSVPPDPSELGWKDTVRADPGMVTRVIARFEDYVGKFAYHCHILEHEDHEMMRQFFSVPALTAVMSRNNIIWASQIGANQYDIVRGDLYELRASGGNYALSSVTELCYANGNNFTVINHGPDPGPGEGYFMLVRVIDDAGNRTYDTGSPSQFDYRDDEIAASGNDCP